MHEGHGSGLSTIPLGARGGTETNTLSIATLPSHTHTASATGITAAFSNGKSTIPVNNEDEVVDESSPSDGLFAKTETDIYTSENANAVYAGNVKVTGDVTITGGDITVEKTGGQLPVNNVQPFLAINFIIATQGDFPSRN